MKSIPGTYKIQNRSGGFLRTDERTQIEDNLLLNILSLAKEVCCFDWSVREVLETWLWCCQEEKTHRFITNWLFSCSFWLIKRQLHQNAKKRFLISSFHHNWPPTNKPQHSLDVIFITFCAIVPLLHYIDICLLFMFFRVN